MPQQGQNHRLENLTSAIDSLLHESSIIKEHSKAIEELQAFVHEVSSKLKDGETHDAQPDTSQEVPDSELNRTDPIPSKNHDGPYFAAKPLAPGQLSPQDRVFIVLSDGRVDIGIYMGNMLSLNISIHNGLVFSYTPEGAIGALIKGQQIKQANDYLR